MTRHVAGLALLAGLVVALAAMLVQLSPPNAGAQVPERLPEPSGISVLGEGVVLAPPDQARSVFGVEVVDPSLATAQQEAASRMSAVLDRLVQAGVDPKDIKTVRFIVQPEFDNRSGQPVLAGFRVSNAVAVTLKDIDAVGRTIDAVVAAGAVRVEGVSFEVADPSGLKDQAREQAMNNARAKAEQLARLGGVTLGKPIRIEESDLGGVRPLQAAPAARAAAAPETPIMPGELEIRTQVQVVFAIQ
ncbi:MAG: SIMPL domain-containing protein [Chloroflexi bacterium]|nr:SIMPL domain-containing protein [Chloroflexota bacterium]